jgi:hypothetical protein
MAEKEDAIYFQYLKAFAVVHGGGQLLASEFSSMSIAGNVEMAAALTLGVEDGKNRTESRTQKDVLQAISKMRA